MSTDATRIVAVASAKGGVGKTTSVYALGDALATYHQRVLLVDLDPQCSLTLIAGHNPAELDRTILAALEHVIERREPLPLEAYALTLQPGLDLLPSTLRLVNAGKRLASASRSEYILDRALEPAHSRYDVVLIDCAPSLELLTVNAMTAAHEVIIPLPPEYLAVWGMTLVQEKIEEVRADRLNPGLQIAGLLLTMVERHTTHTRAMQQIVTRDLADYPILAEIKRTTAIKNATYQGQPITRFEPDGETAQAYRQAARALLAHWKRPVPIDAADPLTVTI